MSNGLEYRASLAPGKHISLKRTAPSRLRRAFTATAPALELYTFVHYCDKDSFVLSETLPFGRRLSLRVLQLLYIPDHPFRHHRELWKHPWWKSLERRYWSSSGSIGGGIQAYRSLRRFTVSKGIQFVTAGRKRAFRPMQA